MLYDCQLSVAQYLFGKYKKKCFHVSGLINQVQSNPEAASHEPSLTFLVKSALFKEIPGVEIIWMVAKTCDCETGDLHRICFGLSKFLFCQPVLKAPVWGNLLLEGPVFESDPLWQSPPIQQSGRPTLGTRVPEGRSGALTVLYETILSWEKWQWPPLLWEDCTLMRVQDPER